MTLLTLLSSVYVLCTTVCHDIFDSNHTLRMILCTVLCSALIYEAECLYAFVYCLFR